jgi:hypothetical protein
MTRNFSPVITGRNAQVLDGGLINSDRRTLS